MKNVEAVLEKCQNQPIVMDCPECRGEFWNPEEVKFIRQYGMCTSCDEKLCNDKPNTLQELCRRYGVAY